MSICESCRNALPQLCTFICDKDPEPALAAMDAKAIRSKTKYGETIHKVISCRNYKTGKLLPIPEHKYVNIPVAITAKYDLSCPRCGRNGESVSIASSNQVKPESWYCRCSVCNKSFYPKKKGSDNLATRLERAREKISKEQYIDLKNEGLSDTKILEQVGLGSWSDVLTALKKEWGLEGFDLRKMAREPSINTESEATSNKNQEPTECEEIEFAIPSQPAGVPLLRIHDSGISLNACAVTHFKDVKYLRIGVLNKIIVLVPSMDRVGCYICRMHGSTIKIGGSGLTRFFTERGLRQGKYSIKHNPEKNRWESTAALKVV